MIIDWSEAAENDIQRLGEFVASFDLGLALTVENRLYDGPSQLALFPRRGRPLDGFDLRDVREFAIGRYLMRYEIADDTLFVLRFFHGREDR